MSGVVTVDTAGLLFDMDGVLVSSIGSVNRSWRRWAEHYGVAVGASYQIPHGTRAVDIIKTLKPELNVAEGLRYIEDLELDDVDDLEVLPGVSALLESLPPERWAIVTSATRRLLLGRLAAAKLPVPTRVIAGDEVVKGKPDPEPYMKGAALLGFSSAECIVVEDAPSGVGSGVASGSPVLGVLGTHSEEALRAAGVKWVVRSMEDVRAATVADGLRLSLAVV